MSKYINLDECEFRKEYYPNQRIAIRLVNKKFWQPIATMTVNVVDQPLEVGKIIVKSYSENEGLIEDLIERDYVTHVKAIKVGYTLAFECSMTDKLRQLLK